MKAAQIKNYGGPDVIEIVDVEKPKAGPGQVLVKVYASSINPFDIAIIKGFVAQMTDSKLPMTIGLDISGVVAELGEGVDSFVVGNKVYGSGGVLSGGSGSFAEFSAVPAKNIAKMPSNLDFNQSAAVVLTGVSTVQALVEHIKLQPGQKILIHGGAGGIGTMAIQIAKSIGAYVATTASDTGIDYAKKLRADHVIDYKKEKFEELISDYDAVFDTVGGEVFEKSFKVLKKGGIIVSMLVRDGKELSEKYQVASIYQSTKVNTGSLNMLTDFTENKGVRAHIDKVFSFDRIKDAFKEQESGEVKGKIVIEINK